MPPISHWLFLFVTPTFSLVEVWRSPKDEPHGDGASRRASKWVISGWWCVGLDCCFLSWYVSLSKWDFTHQRCVNVTIFLTGDLPLSRYCLGAVLWLSVQLPVAVEFLLPAGGGKRWQQDYKTVVLATRFLAAGSGERMLHEVPARKVALESMGQHGLYWINKIPDCV